METKAPNYLSHLLSAKSWILFGASILILCSSVTADASYKVKCSELRMGQYRCNETDIDPDTQQHRGCKQDNLADAKCEATPGLLCLESNGTSPFFTKKIPCKWTNGYSYSTTLLLSVFTGMLGADRFYLGHLGMGTLKFCTLGFLFIGHIVDIILIATETVLPNDGSNYVVGYYGPAVTSLRSNNMTYIVRKQDWLVSSASRGGEL